jgi:hypothetical protein
MVLHRLICTKCKCPLVPPSGQATSVACPRCNTWLDIDPACSGSCLGCHKLHQVQKSTCVEEVSPKSDQYGEKCDLNGVQRNVWAGGSGVHKSLAERWKAVVRSLFR